MEKWLVGSGCLLEWLVGFVSGWVYQIGLETVEEEVAVLGVNVGHPIVINGDFVA